jgi:hypothetical protein
MQVGRRPTRAQRPPRSRWIRCRCCGASDPDRRWLPLRARMQADPPESDGGVEEASCRRELLFQLGQGALQVQPLLHCDVYGSERVVDAVARRTRSFYVATAQRAETAASTVPITTMVMGMRPSCSRGSVSGHSIPPAPASSERHALRSVRPKDRRSDRKGSRLRERQPDEQESARNRLIAAWRGMASRGLAAKGTPGAWYRDWRDEHRWDHPACERHAGEHARLRAFRQFARRKRHRRFPATAARGIAGERHACDHGSRAGGYGTSENELATAEPSTTDG